MAKPSTSQLCCAVTWRQPLVCTASPSSTKAPIPARIGWVIGSGQVSIAWAAFRALSRCALASAAVSD